ncbi:hypothetical protein BJ875DRAFT_486979 [Amylocarpus encephaloides]|uniref:Uncharacterized protein n=1 Tax=Amylocarpus encephaloides TaxID=45428 RepID=A0A9P7YD59_9HELO|nr:hypothetical protein BJ875DRAFT_486979 [Amylocarpus encephaloides]
MQFKESTILAFIALMGQLASAVPTMSVRTPVDETRYNEIMETLKQDGVTFDWSTVERRWEEDSVPGFTKRVTVDDSFPVNKIPECKDDPSYAIPKKTGYSINQGYKVPKIGSKDACDNGYLLKKDRCWTEQWWVETEIVFENWKNTGFAIDCAKTSSCSTTTIDLGQTCTSHSVSNDNGFEQGIEGKLEFAIASGGKFTIGTNPKYSYKHSEGDTSTICTSESSQARCTFDDEKCHSVWSAQRNMKIHGHLQRVCYRGNDSNGIQQNTKRDDGTYVRGQLGYSFTYPINKMVGCAALCGDQTYPDPTPAEGNGREPLSWA